jgi:asparagine synthase (glutamine-hydrolysing)
MIADYLLGRFDDKGRTFYADIHRLPPASTMVVGKNGIRIREYWKLDPRREIRLSSDREYAEAFLEIFLKAVRCRLRSAFPVGSMLSGGLDSSSIACAARDMMMSGRGDELHTFSIVFDQLKESDERLYIQKVLATKGFMAHLICGDKASPFDGLDNVLNYQDEPFFAPNLFLARLGWRSAKANGVRVLLDGLLGDNTVSHGIEHLNELARHWRWLALARELGKIIRISGSAVSLWKLLRRYIVYEGIRPYVPERGLALWRMMRRSEVDPVGGQCEIFTPEYCARINLRKRLELAYKFERAMRSSRRVHCDSLSSGMVNTALEVYSKGCSEFAIEPRYPFADKRLVELCLAIPGSQKVADGYTRIVLRRALEQTLPAEICWRTGKGNLESSFINGFGASRDLVRTTIRSSQRFLERFVNYRKIERRLIKCLGGRSTCEDEFPLFLITVLARWNAKTGVS